MKRVPRKLEELAVDFRLLFESAPGLFLVLRARHDFTIVAVSDSYLRAMMTKREEILGRGIFDVFPDNPDDPDATGIQTLRDSLTRAIETGAADAMAVQKYDIRRPDEEGGGFEERFWSPLNTPVFGPDGQATYIIHRVEDVTDFIRLKTHGVEQAKQAEALKSRTGELESEIFRRAQKIQEANKQLRLREQERSQLLDRLKKLDLLKTQFFANVSQELRTPLTLILGPVDYLLSKEGSSTPKHHLKLIQRNAKILLRHVNDLLDISKLESGKLFLHYTKVDLAKVVREVAANFETVAQDRHISFSIQTPQALSAEMDLEKTQRILMNLLSNALKFTPDNGEILCSLERKRSALGEELNGSAVISVSDSGPGIPEKYREAVFERFYQIEESFIPRHGGTGLGLAVVKEFVDLQGGKIRLDQAPSGGSRFQIEIPLSAPKGTLVGEEPTEAILAVPEACLETRKQELPVFSNITGHITSTPDVSGPDRRPRVLIVEDNPDMNQYLCDALATEYRIEHATTGKEGLAKALKSLPDLILTDMMMPMMTGAEIFNELKTHGVIDQVPIVVLTAKAEDELLIQLLKEGVHDYLIKPFLMNELKARVRNLLRSKKVKEELQTVETKFRDLVESAPDAFVIANRAGVIEMINRQAENWFGYDRAELIGQPIEVLLPERFRNKHIHLRTDYISKPKTGPMGEGLEVYARRKDGSEFRVEVSLSPLATQNGPLVTSIIRDISEKITLVELSSRFQFALRSAQVGTWNWTVKENKLIWDETMEAVFGLSPGEFQGSLEFFLAIVHPDDRERVNRAVLSSVETNSSYNIEYRIIWKDGSLHHISARGEASYSSDGSSTKMAGVCWDISDKKSAELRLLVLNQTLEKKVQERTATLEKANEELNKLERFRKSIFDSSRDCIKILDLDGHLLFMNVSGQKLLEVCDINLFLGMSWIEFWKEADREAAIKAIADAKMGRTGQFVGYYLTEQTHTPMWFDIIVTLIVDSSGKPIQLLAISRDITEKKKAEKALHESEFKFRRIFESDMVGLVYWNLDGRIVDANHAFLESVGYSNEDLTESRINWKQITPPEWTGIDAKAIKQLLETGVTPPFEKEYFRKDGSRVPVIIVASTLEGVSGVNGISYVLDISVRKEAERQFKESQLQFQTLANTIPNLAWIAKGDGFIYWYNKRWYEYTGTTPQQMEGWGWQSVHDAKELPRVLERWKFSIETGKLFEMEYPLKGADGRFRWFLTRITPVMNSEGKVERWFATNTDIENQKQVEHILKHAQSELERKVQERTVELVKEKERFRLIVQNVKGYAMFLLDPTGHVASWNEGAKRIQLYEESEIMGKHFSIFYENDARIAREPEIGLEVARTQGRFEEEGWRIRKDGSRFWANVNITAIRSPKGDILGFSEITRDLTEKKKTEDTLRASEESLAKKAYELQQSNFELEQFAYVASHDLQTPLRHITSYVQLLSEKYSSKNDPDGDKWVNYIISGTRQMQTLISDLLTFSRVGRVGTAFQQTVVSELLSRVIENLKDKVTLTGAEIVTGPMPTLFGVTSQLEQIFQNLIENSLKFRRPDVQSRIEIRCEDDGDFWRFTVTDNGIGIDPKFSTRIFGMFQRLHTHKEYSGTGIGLAICKKIAEFHGGKIWVESSLGKGTKFYFTLAKANPQVASVPGLTRKVDLPNQNKEEDLAS